jgi:hypothetical protein
MLINSNPAFHVTLNPRRSCNKQTDAGRSQRESGDMLIPLPFGVSDETAVQLAAVLFS